MTSEGRGFLGEDFIFSDYLRERCGESPAQDGMDVLMDALLRMNELLEGRFQELADRVSREAARRESPPEIGMLLFDPSGRRQKPKGFHPIFQEEEERGTEERIFLFAEDSVCEAFLREGKFPFHYRLDGRETEGIAFVRRENQAGERVRELREAFLFCALPWHCIPMAYPEHCFILEFPALPEGAEGPDFSFGSFSPYVRRGLELLWNVSAHRFSARDFLSPAEDGVYYEYEISAGTEGAFPLLSYQEGFLSLRRERGKLILRTSRANLPHLSGFLIHPIEEKRRREPEGLLSNQREESLLERLREMSHPPALTEAELRRQAASLLLSSGLSLEEIRGFREGEPLPEGLYFSGDREQRLRGLGPLLLLAFRREGGDVFSESMLRYLLESMGESFPDCRFAGCFLQGSVF